MRSLYAITLFTFTLVSPLLAAPDITLPSGVTVAPGQQAAYLVTLASPAPAGGIFLNLVSSNQSIVSVSPSSVYVSGGKSNVPVVTISGISLGTASITVSAYGLTGDTQTVTVSAQTATLTFLPQSISVPAGTPLPATQKVQLVLSTAAPAGGLFVSLTTDNPGVAQVQPGIAFFPDGSSQAINSVPINLVGPGTTTIHASAPSITDTTLTVTVGNSGPPAPGTISLPGGITLSPGQSAPFPVTLSTPAPAGGVTVSLSSGSPSVTIAPSSVSVAAGATTPVTQPQVTGVSSGSATITATAPGYSQGSQTVQVGSNSLSFSPTTLNLAALGASNLQLNLSSPAPAGGLTVALSSTNSAVVTVPASVSFAANATSANVPVTAIAAGTATISASAPNVNGAAASVIVSSNSTRDIILPSGLALAPGDLLRFVLTLSKPAPSGGVFVVLNSSDPSKVIIAPTGVFISEGSTTASVQPRLTGIDFGSSTITASATGLIGDSQVVLVGTAHGLVPAALTINGIGATQNLTLTLSSPAPAGGITFNLSSSNPGVATVPGSVTVFANATSATVPVTTVGAGSTVIHSSSLPGFGDVSATVTVVSTGTIGLPSGLVLAAGQSAPFPVTLGTPAPAGGLTVTLGSTDPTKVSISPASVTIAAGATTPATQPQVTALAPGSANINASAPGFTSASQTVQVSVALTFTPTTLTLNAGASASVALNLSTAIPVTINLTSSNPGVATVPATVTFIGSGQSLQMVTVNAVAGGSTLITASGPGVTSATLNVSVSGGGGNVGNISLPANVILGTNQPVPFPVTLSVPAPAGGVTVALSSNSPAVTITPSVFVAGGAVTPATQPQVMGTAYGTATISASAPGYSPASQQVQVSATLSFSPTSLTVSSAGTNNLQLNLSSPAPAGGLSVNLSSSNPAAFTVPSKVTIAANATSVTVPVTSVAGGSATITASSSAPNVASANASASFSNSGPDILLPSGLSLLPGDQLKISINLAKPAATGGVFVSLASSDTSIVTVLPSSIFIPEGQTTSIRQAQLTGINFGSTMISASATGLNGDSETVRVGSPSGFSPTSLAFSGPGSTQNLQLAIASPAPAGGLVVALSSTNTAVATVPATVTFAAGATSANVPVTSVGTGSAVIHASAPPTLLDTTASVTVLTAGSIALPAISQVSLGQQLAFPITIGTPAPAGGVTVTLTSSLKTSVALSVGSVFIPAGAITPAAQPTLSAFNTGSVTITASAPGYVTATRNILSTATVTWTPTSTIVNSLAPIRVLLSLSASAPPGTTTAGRCESPDPTTCSVTVALSSDNQNVAQIQSSISFFPDGSSQAINQITINIIGPGTTLIHAGAPPFIPDTTLSITVVGAGGIQAPIANAGTNQTVAIGATVHLSGAGSDPQSLPLTMQWSLTKPATSTAVLSSTTIPNPTFVADKSGTYTAQLVVNNGTLSSPPSSVTVSTQRPKPMANAGTNQNVSVGATVTLNGGASSAVDSSPLTYAWTLTRPNGSNAVLNGPATVSPTFVADVAGTYTAQLTVNDGFLTSDPASVTIGASGAGPAGSISATSGTPQTTGVSQVLCAPLVATVLDASNTPVSNVTVTFTAPLSGASGIFPSGATATSVTDAFGRASSPAFTANGTAGPYSITATPPNTMGSATFAITNVALPQVNITAASGTPQTASVNTIFPAPLVASVTSSTCGGPQSGVTVTFTAPASGPGGMFAGGNTTITAISDTNGLATSPAFAANSQSGSYTVTASATGAPSQASFSLTNTQPVAPGSIVVSNVSVGQNLQTIVTVTLPKPAPNGGVLLNVSSSDFSKLVITPHQFTAGAGSVNIPIAGGLTTGAFFVQGLASSGTVTLTVTTPDNSGTGTITLSPSGFALTGPGGLGASSFSTGVGTSSTLTVYSGRLDGSLNLVEPQPLRGGLSLTVPVVSSDTNTGSISLSPVAFNGGDNITATTQLNALASGNIVVSATAPAGFSTPVNAGLNVSIGVLNMVVPNVTVGKDLESDLQQITLTGAAPNGGLTITLTSNDQSKVLLSSDPNLAGTGAITLGIPTGQTHSQNFYVHALASSGNVTYTASAPGVPDAIGTVTLTPSGVVISGPYGIGQPSFPTVTGGPTQPVTVWTVQLAPGTANVGQVQRLRGNVSATASVTSSDTTIGTITTSPVTINGGSSSAVTNFQSVSQGQATLTVGVPAGFSVPAQDTTVVANVMKQGINVSDQLSVGNKLEVGGSLLLAQQAPAGGVTVTLTSNDPKLLLAATATGQPQSSIPVVVAAGSNNANFFLVGAGSSGSATYTASAPGYQGGTGTVFLGPSGVVISGPFGGPGFQFPVNTKISSPPTPLSIAVAMLDANGTYVAQQQLAGGSPLTVSLTAQPSNIGTLPSTVTIAAGTTSTSASFTPTANGSTVVSVLIPAGFTPAASIDAQIQIKVTP